jgi:phage-related baseplate assembly protein
MSVNFVTVDDETIRSDLLADFEEAIGVSLTEGDARRIFLEQFAPVLVAQYNAINTAGRNNLIDYATGDYLDAIGARWGDLGTRLPAQYATATLQFTLSAAQAFDVVVPAGTRATIADSSLFFAVTQDLTITAGNTTGTVTAQATATGATYNGFTTGLINKIVDPIAYVTSVSNTTTSASGADIEDDDSYRARLKLVFSASSTAGSALSYKYWALSADSTISDVSVSTPSAGNVTVTLLCDNGTVPTADIITDVTNTLEPYRPLTDNITVQAPAAVDYTINFTYYINSADSSQVATIQAAVTAAVTNYIAWQCEKLGRDINPDYLRKLVLNAGASRLTKQLRH